MKDISPNLRPENCVECGEWFWSAGGHRCRDCSPLQKSTGDYYRRLTDEEIGELQLAAVPFLTSSTPIRMDLSESEIRLIVQQNVARHAKDGSSIQAFAAAAGVTNFVIKKFVDGKGVRRTRKSVLEKVTAEIEKRGWKLAELEKAPEEPEVEKTVLAQDEPAQDEPAGADMDVWQTALVTKAIMDLDIPKNDKLSLLHAYVFH